MVSTAYALGQASAWIILCIITLWWMKNGKRIINKYIFKKNETRNKEA